MTEFLQPLWDLFTPKGANQETQYTGRSFTDSPYAMARNDKSFKLKVQYPQATHHQIKYGNVNTNTVTAAQNKETGIVLRDATAGADPRVDNTAANPYDMANMNIQRTSFFNTSGAVVAIGGFLLFAVLLMTIRGKGK